MEQLEEETMLRQKYVDVMQAEVAESLKRKLADRRKQSSTRPSLDFPS